MLISRKCEPHGVSLSRQEYKLVLEIVKVAQQNDGVNP